MLFLIFYSLFIITTKQHGLPDGYLYSPLNKKYIYFPSYEKNAISTYSDSPLSFIKFKVLTTSSFEYYAYLPSPRQNEVLDSDQTHKKLYGYGFHSGGNQIITIEAKNELNKSYVLKNKGQCLTGGYVEAHWDFCEGTEDQEWQILKPTDLEEEIEIIEKGEL